MFAVRWFFFFFWFGAHSMYTLACSDMHHRLVLVSCSHNFYLICKSAQDCADERVRVLTASVAIHHSCLLDIVSPYFGGHCDGIRHTYTRISLCSQNMQGLRVSSVVLRSLMFFVSHHCITYKHFKVVSVWGELGGCSMYIAGAVAASIGSTKSLEWWKRWNVRSHHLARITLL